MRTIILITLLAILCVSCSQRLGTAEAPLGVVQQTVAHPRYTLPVDKTTSLDHSLTATANWARFQATMSAIKTQIMETKEPPTPSPAPMLIPLPSLNPEEYRNRMTYLLSTNGKCTGDCFWGINPATTNFSQAVQYFKMLYETKPAEKDNAYSNIFLFPEKPIYVSVQITGAGGRIRSLKATVVGLETRDVIGENWLAFRPDHFLKDHGVPKQVFVVISEGPEGRLTYGLAFIYENMVTIYNGSQVTFKPKTILHACPNGDHNISRFDLIIGEYDAKIFDGWVDLTRMSPLSPAQLYETVIQSGAVACFDLDYNRFLSSK